MVGVRINIVNLGENVPQKGLAVPEPECSPKQSVTKHLQQELVPSLLYAWRTNTINEHRDPIAPLGVERPLEPGPMAVLARGD